MSSSKWRVATVAVWIVGCATAGRLQPAPDASRGAASVANREDEMLESCRREIRELHAFFQGWFRGELEDSDASYARFGDVLASDFEIVSPEGRRTPRRDLVAALRTTHGKDAPTARIWTQSERIRPIGDGLWLATYEEWQEQSGSETRRISSALFRGRTDTPNGVEWLHVHETWIDGD